MAQILKSIVLAEATHGELYKIADKFKNVIKNVKRFNGEYLKYELKRVANGKQFFAYNQAGVLLVEYSLLSDRYGHELRATTYSRG